MREFISVDREVNAIRMRRSTFPGAFLLVEGSSDKSFYARFFNPGTCALITLSGRPSSKFRVIEVLTILEAANFPGIVAIVDADFDRLEKCVPTSPNLLFTDTHDLETMLLQSPALDKVMSEYGSTEKIQKFGQDIRSALLNAAMPIGYLLWISQLDQLNLKFAGIQFSQFIDLQSLQINASKFVQEVKNKSQAQNLKSEDLQKRLTNQKDPNHDPWQVCCGHHLVEILSLGLRKALGSANPSDVKPDSLERSLRLAYEAVYFRHTQIYIALCAWETANPPFPILSHFISNPPNP